MYSYLGPYYWRNPKTKNIVTTLQRKNKESTTPLTPVNKNDYKQLIINSSVLFKRGISYRTVVVPSALTRLTEILPLPISLAQLQASEEDFKSLKDLMEKHKPDNLKGDRSTAWNPEGYNKWYSISIESISSVIAQAAVKHVGKYAYVAVIPINPNGEHWNPSFKYTAAPAVALTALSSISLEDVELEEKIFYTHFNSRKGPEGTKGIFVSRA